ncbi:MAG: NAD(P)-dependent oxidoreductase [Gemmataceae bacterium]
MATVLVTGSTGFIGKTLTQALLARGDRVRCLVRSARRLPPGLEAVRGDITQPFSLDDALTGVDVVYHLAGATLVRHPVDYRRVNALGTRHLAEACAAQSRPPVVVYLSSLAAVGPALPDRPRTEDDPPAPVSRYGHSKLAGERALARWSDSVPTTIIRAPSVIGPGDPNFVRLFLAARAGINGVPGSKLIRLSILHVDDLVAHLLAAAERGERLTRDQSRGVYFAALDEAPTLDELGQMAGQLMGRKVRTIGLPFWFCWAWSHGVDMFIALTGQPRLLTSDKIREAFAGSWTCSPRKAQRQLGVTCRLGLTEAVASTFAWYRDHRWL